MRTVVLNMANHDNPFQADLDASGFLAGRFSLLVEDEILLVDEFDVDLEVFALVPLLAADRVMEDELAVDFLARGHGDVASDGFGLLRGEGGIGHEDGVVIISAGGG